MMPSALAWIMAQVVSSFVASAPADEPVPPELPDAPADPEPAADSERVDPPVEPAVADPPPPVSGDAPFEPLDLRSPDESLPPGAAEDWRRGYVKIERPRFAGTGLFIGAGVSFVLGISFQLGDTFVCGECATGVVERLFFAGAMGFSAGGGVMRAYADAYDDAALRRSPRSTRGLLVAGATLTAVGATLGLVNDGLWWACVGGHGPYQTTPDDEFFSGYSCRYGTTRAILDLSTVTTSAGLGMLTYALVYRRDAKMYERARIIGLMPAIDRRRIGVQIGGRF